MADVSCPRKAKRNSFKRSVSSSEFQENAVIRIPTPFALLANDRLRSEPSTWTGSSETSDNDHPELRIEPLQIEWVAGDHGITLGSRAYNDVGVDDVRGAGPRKQCPNGLGMRSIQRDDLRCIELDHAPKAYLSGRVPDDLRQSRSGNQDAVSILQSRTENGKDPTVIAFHGNKTASVESNPVHAVFRRLVRAESIFLAHARSLRLSGPPVSFKASSTIARNSAAFSRDF